MIWMDVDTALSEVPVNFMPLIDDTDFKSRETSVAYNAPGMDLVWNFVTTGGAMSQTAVTPTTAGVYDWTNQGDGMYSIEIPASGGASINNDTEGYGWFTGFATGVLPWAGPVIGFRAAALNNALIDGGDELDVNVVQVGGDAQSATDLKDFADAGYDPATNKVEGVKLADSLTAVATAGITAGSIATDAIGSDELAASAITEIQAGLSTLDAAGVRTAVGLATANLDTQLGDLPTNAELATALAAADDAVLAAIAALNNLSQANIRTAIGLGSANLDTQLADLPTNGELTTALAAADDAVLAAISGLNNLSTGQVGATVEAALAVYGAALETTAQTLLTRANRVNALIENVGGDRWTEKSLEQAPSSGGGGSTPEEIADAVREELEPELELITTNLDAKISELLPGESQTLVISSDDCDEVQRMDAGEKRNIGASLAATGGVITVSSVTVTLEDAEENAVYGIEDVAATDFTAGGVVQCVAFYELDSVTPPDDGPIAVGTYNMVFTFTGTASDGSDFVREVHITVVVE